MHLILQNNQLFSIRTNSHPCLENDFKILGDNDQSNIQRKITESLYIRQLKPTLNANEKSIPLHIFNWFFHSNYPERCLSNHLLKVIINNIVVWQLIVLYCF